MLDSKALEGRIALVTGANRGLGKEVARQLAELGARVVLTARDPERCERAATELRSRDLEVHAHPLDVTRADEVDAIATWIESKLGAVDVLINNAAVYLDDPRRSTNAQPTEPDAELLRSTLEVNVIGPFRLIRRFLPSMKRRNYGRVVNVSSGMGRTVELDSDAQCYRLSKSALNAMTRMVALEVEQYDIRVNAVCPGWLRTRMGGESAPRDVQMGAHGVVIAASIPAGGLNGWLLRDGERFGW